MEQGTIEEKSALELKFEQYDAENPKVWAAFVRLTFQLISAGRTHYSSDGILHKIRFETAIAGNDDFKINNSYAAFYSRKFMNTYQKHKDFFSIRKQKAA